MKFSKKATILSISIAASLFGASAYAASAAESELNPYSPRAGHSYRHGAHATKEAHGQMQGWIKKQADKNIVNGTAVAGNRMLSFGGGVNGIGVTSGTPKVYLVVYGTQWGTAGTNAAGNMTLSGDALGAVPYLEAMFKGLGTNGELWSGVMTQYCDGPLVANGATSCPAGAPHVGYPTGGAFAGIWYDNASASPSAATGAQLANEAIRAAAHFGNTTAASNRYVQYVILSPTGTKPDGFNTPQGGFCAWHDWTGDQGVTSPYGDIAFTNMPYVADMGTSCGQGSVNGSTNGKLDGFSIVEGHEYAETVTDQNPAGGWTNHTGDANYNGQENADECSWLTVSADGAQAGSQNVSMATGTFAMQSTWSNDTNACNISHAIVGGGGGGTPNCNATPVNGASLSCAAAGLSGYTGTAYTKMYSTYTGGGSCTQVATGSYDTSACVAPDTTLTKGVAKTGLAQATGTSTVYTFAVPAGATNLTFKTSGGTGDMDLYVKLGSAPTTSSYGWTSGGSTTTESITVAAPTAGTYYVMVYGYASASGVSLVADYSTGGGGGGNVLTNNVAVTGISLASSASKTWTMVVPSGTPSVTFSTSGGSGDSDLYVQLNAQPTTSSYLKRSIGSTTAETITITAPTAGTYYVMVYGYSAPSGVTLLGKY
ncbi:MAG: PPC domain-containing protein [Pseudomonadota bacterium]